jgi:hypothetical protein
MKKQFILLAFMLSGSFLARAEDPISECIKKYDIKKLQEIASQNLVMRVEDRQKYLNQLALLKEQINQVKQDTKTGGVSRIIPEGFAPKQTRILSNVFLLWSAAAFSALAGKFMYDEIPVNDHRRTVMAFVSWLMSGISFGLGCKTLFGLTLFELADKLFRKIIVMEHLIKTIPVAKEVAIE